MIRSKHVRFSLDGRAFVLVRSTDVVTAPDAMAELAAELLADADHRARWLARLGLRDDADEATLRTRLVDELRGEWLVIDANADLGLAPWSPSQPRRPDPVEPPKPDPPPSERTWIELTIVDESGATYPGTRWRLALPDGRDAPIVLDEASTYRVDDLAERGSCHLRALAEVQPSGPRLSGWTGRDARDPWLAPRPPGTVMLATGRSHRVVIVRGRTEVLMLDEADRPIVGERVRVRVAGAVHSLSTDERGLVEIHHPHDQPDLEIEFPRLADDVWSPLREEPLPPA